MDEAIEETLCFGWIDSLPRKLDDERTVLFFARRKKGSAWSAVNIARVERLIAQNLMTPAGLEKIEAAKQDGSWSKLEQVNALIVPDDLAAALAARPTAAEAFAGFPPSTRRGVLEWLGATKTQETSQKRITHIADKAARGERANQWRKPKA